MTIHRMTSLARGEALLLWRSPLALLNVATVPALVALFSNAPVTGGPLADGGSAALIIAMTAFSLLLVVYFNLVLALVARREELVLKQLRTGECSDAELLAGAAIPAVALAWAQVAIGIGIAIALRGAPRLTNPGLVVIALLLGTLVFGLLAAVSTTFTASTELAQLTTLPGYLIPAVLSGLIIPLSSLAAPVRELARFAPLTPVVDLLRLGLTGTEADGSRVDTLASFGAAAVPITILLGWVLLGAWATRRWFRWEPRR